MGATVPEKDWSHKSDRYRDGTLYNLRGRVPILYREEPDGSFPAQVLEPPILATICLLSSSVTIMLAERAFRNEAHGSFKFWWLITIVLAVVFLGWTALEWRRLIYQHNLTIATNLFGTSFYSLVGLHATHVVAGLTLLTLVFWLSLRGVVTRSYSEHIEMISWYWHFVDAVWVVVFTVVYIIGR